MHATRRLAVSIVLLALVAVAGCAGSDPPPSRPMRDAGTDSGPVVLVDSGGRPDGNVPLPEGCGDARQACCRGTLCAVGLTCVAGTCTAPAGCGASADPCCSGTACSAGLVCTAGTCTAEPACGASGEACCGGDACGAGLVCDRGSCAPTTACGSVRQPCCSGTACASGLVCTAGTCDTAAACGGARQPCCAGSACNADLTCTSGTCDSPTAPPDVCAGATSCDACTAMSACGFCESTGTCAEGSLFGPTSGSCADWSWFRLFCGAAADPCASTTSCDGCTAQASCGFCRSSSTCATGTSTGPSAGSCAEWAWTASACAGPADPCTTAAMVCGDCTRMGSCGFCASSDTCLTGGSSGPTVGTCSDWRYVVSECAPADPCAANVACGTCAAASGCGWCETSGDCLTGTSGGPTAGSCADWRYTTTSCTPPDPCATNVACGTCAAASGCGWCETSGDCLTGTSGGPTAGSCGDWRYTVSSCTPPDPCATNLTCNVCAAASGCGWCDDTFDCLTGTSTGPTVGTCTDWSWSTTTCP